MAATLDFGWRLHGRRVSLLDDGMTHLGVTGPIAGIPCLQCGICTASCPLAEADASFPRRTLAMLQQGAQSRVLRQPALWQCHACGDCTERCPARLDPARVLADCRREAMVAVTAAPRVARALGTWWGFAGSFLGTMVLAFIAAWALGDVWPAGAVRYANFLPHPVIVVAFGCASAVAALATARAAWRLRKGLELPAAASSGALGASLKTAIDALSHRRHAACGGSKGAARAHAAILFGVLGLALTTAWIASSTSRGASYPVAFTHPAKLLANVLALAIVLGSGHVLSSRYRWRKPGSTPQAFDAFLPAVLFGLGVTGVALEGLRHGGPSAWAYIVYAVHLAFAGQLLVFWPWTKAAHGVHRFVALTAWCQHSPGRSPRPEPASGSVAMEKADAARTLGLDSSW